MRKFRIYKGSFDYDYVVQFLRKVSYSEQKERTAYTKDKAALNVILSNWTRPRTFSR